jgi:hypothetical protein
MRQLKISALMPALALLAMLGAPALGGASETFRARLTGPQEVPVCSTTGRGTAEVTIADDESRIDFAVTYALEGDVTVAHIHLGKPTEAGGVVVFFCGGGGKPACPPSPNTVTGTIAPHDVVGPEEQGISAGEFEELLRELRRRLTYANVHSDICPSGEVRGQLL